MRLTIPRRDSTVSVIAYNDKGAGEPAKVRVQWTGAHVEPKLTLYVLAIRVSNYKESNLRLHFAAKDAQDFVALAKAQGQVRSSLDKRVGALVTVGLAAGALRAVKSLSISSRIALN